MNIRRIGLLGLLAPALLLLFAVEQPVTAVPLAQEGTPSPDANVLFQDDFSDPSSGWDADGRASYKSGITASLPDSQTLPIKQTTPQPQEDVTRGRGSDTSNRRHAHSGPDPCNGGASPGAAG